MVETCKVSIEQYEFKKVKKLDAEIQIPLEPMFYQEWNYRTIIGLFPEFATWGDGSVWKINIIKITDDTILLANLRTSPGELSDTISRLNLTPKNNKETLVDNVATHLLHFFEEGEVTREVFEAKFNAAVAGLSATINIIY